MSAAEGPKSAGIPPWMATFADLMALMMTFFVLLFAFSKVEEEKFKSIAGSMATAFGGVQYIKSNSEDPTPGMEQGVVSRTGSMALPIDQQTRQAVAQEVRQDQAEELRQRLETELAEEIVKQSLVIEKEGDDVLIRFPEHVSFASGSATLVPTAIPLLRRVVGVISDQRQIVVAGHTDNRPVGGGRFSSNWELSASRAAAVADALIAEGSVQAGSVTVAGYADTRPIDSNDSAEQRARNRRVEIIVKTTPATA